MIVKCCTNKLSIHLLSMKDGIPQLVNLPSEEKIILHVMGLDVPVCLYMLPVRMVDWPNLKGFKLQRLYENVSTPILKQWFTIFPSIFLRTSDQYFHDLKLLIVHCSAEGVFVWSYKHWLLHATPGGKSSTHKAFTVGSDPLSSLTFTGCCRIFFCLPFWKPTATV